MRPCPQLAVAVGVDGACKGEDQAVAVVSRGVAGGGVEKEGVVTKAGRQNKQCFWPALIREGESAREHRDALKELQRLGADFDLDFGPVAQGLAVPGPYTYVSPRVELASAAALLWAADLKQFDDPQDIEISVEVADPGPVGGVAMWFRAVLDEGLEIDNAPGAGGHWGTEVQAWPEHHCATRQTPSAFGAAQRV